MIKKNNKRLDGENIKEKNKKRAQGEGGNKKIRRTVKKNRKK